MYYVQARHLVKTKQNINTSLLGGKKKFNQEKQYKENQNHSTMIMSK